MNQIQTETTAKSSPHLIHKPNVYDYLDYRSYLNDMVDFLRDRGQYSVRKFASKVGFGSSNYLHMVINGKRNLGNKFSLAIAMALSLNKDETSFFLALIGFNDNKDLDKKDEFYQKMMKCKNFQIQKRPDQSQYQLFSDWRVVALYESINTPLMSKDAEEISQKLEMNVTELKAAFETLKNLNLIAQKDGRWVRTDKALDTEPYLQPMLIRNFHRQMIQRALKSVDDRATERSLGALTLPLNEKTYQHIERRLTELRRELSVLYAEDPNPDHVYQLNIQFFPLIRTR